MHGDYRFACVAGAVGLILLLTPGCSMKALQGDKAARSSGQKGGDPATSAISNPFAATLVPSPSSKEEASAPSTKAPAPLPSGSPAEPLTGFEPVKPGTAPAEERVGSGIQVAKVAPTDAGTRVEEMRKEELSTATAGLKDVFFGFDSFTITEEAKEALAHNAEWLKTNQGKTLVIEGHCDERGTQAYNLVLGEKRARAVRNYLVELGVNASRLTVVSFGKERPFCKERDEACYHQNRRGHLVLLAQ